MKKNHHQKESPKLNKLTSILIIILCGLSFMVDGNLMVTAIMLPIALILLFIKVPIIGKKEEDDYPWGGKK